MILLELPKGKSPYFYAAAEEWLVRNYTFSELTLVFYINEPCVVVGKNQCHWKEINWDYLFHSTSKVVRRISGGGTVYHDSGNLCFSFFDAFDEKKVNNYKWFNKPILDALHQMGIAATFSERNDLLFQGKKISGNAQFTNRKNILSHGTLLFQADLKSLRHALTPNSFTIHTKAVSSVRSQVMNLADIYKNDLKQFIQELTRHLDFSQTITLTNNEIDAIEKLENNQYVQKSWIADKSPLADVEKKGACFKIDKGHLFDVQLADLGELTALQGLPFDPNSIRQKLMMSSFTSQKIAKILEHIFY